MEASFWTDQLAGLVRRSKVIVKVELFTQSTGMVELVRAMGAADVLVVVTSGNGTGPLPDVEMISLDLDVSGLSMIDTIHAGNRALHSLPNEIIGRLDEFDPDRTALVIGDFLNDSPTLAGRPFLAYRRQGWLALDDKTTIDAFWDRAGVARSPSMVVDADYRAVSEAFDRLSTGAGVVIAVDATRGFTGGGSGTRPARTRRDVGRAIEGWRGRTVRVSPFLEGVPCSIHGIVFSDDVVVLRPVEMVTLRKADGDFFYCGCASFWDPLPACREAMRATARSVGNQLRGEVAYRGAFTIDGIVREHRFLPTELNPRNGAGLMTMARATDFPIQLLLDELVGGVELDWQPRALETMLLESYDNNRRGGTWSAIAGTIPPGEYPLEGGSAIAGPSTLGSFMRALVDHPTGSMFAPRAAEIWRWADERFGLGLGAMSAASEH
jgi:hypothetical protein